MSLSTRREFLHTSAAVAASTVMNPLALGQEEQPAKPPLIGSPFADPPRPESQDKASAPEQIPPMRTAPTFEEIHRRPIIRRLREILIDNTLIIESRYPPSSNPQEHSENKGSGFIVDLSGLEPGPKFDPRKIIVFTARHCVFRLIQATGRLQHADQTTVTINQGQSLDGPALIRRGSLADTNALSVLGDIAVLLCDPPEDPRTVPPGLRLFTKPLQPGEPLAVVGGSGKNTDTAKFTTFDSFVDGKDIPYTRDAVRHIRTTSNVTLGGDSGGPAACFRHEQHSDGSKEIVPYAAGINVACNFRHDFTLAVPVENGLSLLENMGWLKRKAAPKTSASNR